MARTAPARKTSTRKAPARRPARKRSSSTSALLFWKRWPSLSLVALGALLAMTFVPAADAARVSAVVHGAGSHVAALAHHGDPAPSTPLAGAAPVAP